MIVRKTRWGGQVPSVPRAATTFVFVALTLCVSASIAQPRPQETEGDWTIEVSAEPVYVRWYPFLVRVRVCSQGARDALGIGQDLSWRHLPMSPLQLQLLHVGAASKPVVFGAPSARPAPLPGRSAPVVVPHSGECVASTIDLFVLSAPPDLRADSANKLTLGRWKLTAHRTGFLWFPEKDTAHGNEMGILVRDPTEAEAAVAQALGFKRYGQPPGIRRLVLHPEIRIPDVSALHIEPRRVIELVRVLRGAVGSPEQGLFMIDDEAAGGMDWGFLAPFIEELRYECLVLAGRKDEAASLRKRLTPDGVTNLTLARIDKGLGVVSRFRELKAKESR